LNVNGNPGGVPLWEHWQYRHRRKKQEGTKGGDWNVAGGQFLS
jgi:hypothetical protein